MVKWLIEGGLSVVPVFAMTSGCAAHQLWALMPESPLRRAGRLRGDGIFVQAIVVHSGVLILLAFWLSLILPMLAIAYQFNGLSVHVWLLRLAIVGFFL